MNQILRAWIVIALVWPASAWAQCNVANVVQYDVEFTATWSAQTLPQEFPPNPHFSGITGGSHNSQVTFWENGGLASNSIKFMAEEGDQGRLLDEVDAAILAGNALGRVQGIGIVSPGFTSSNFFLDQARPLATVVAMIAPSPDWFVGVNGLDLFRNGNWVADLSIDLYGYDAGTDSGTTYTSPDSITQPPASIAPLTGGLFMNNGVLVPFGTFRFVRLTASCLDSDGDGVPNETDPDDDNDGILDCVDNEPLVFNNACPDPSSGMVANDATVQDQIDTHSTCVANVSISTSGVTQVSGPVGHLLAVAPIIGLHDGFRVLAGGSLRAISKSPDDPSVCQ